MNVLLLSHLFPPNSGAFVLEQTKALRTLGVTFQVVAPTPWVPRFLTSTERFRRHKSAPLQASVDGFEVQYPRFVCFPRQRFFSVYGLTYYLRCRNMVRRLLRKVDIDLIHAHTIMPDGFAAVLLAKEFNLPVVCTLHGSDISVYPRESRATMWATRWALRRIPNLIAVSADLARKASSMATISDIKVVHNGANPEEFAPFSKNEARQKLGLPVDQKILLFLGRLTPVKCIDNLLTAVSQLAGPKPLTVLVGDGELKQGLMAKATSLGIAENCKFVGQKPYEEVPWWLSAADCLVLPSMSEGLPTVLLEAMCCHTPIIATDVGGVSEIVQPRQTGLLVPANDVHALGEAISEVLTNHQFASALAERAGQIARESLTWAVNAGHTLSWYKAALAAHKKADSATHITKGKPECISV